MASAKQAGRNGRKPAGNGRRYSESEKAVAVQAVLSLGGVVTNEVWKQVRTILKSDTLSFDSLQLWLKAYNTPKESPIYSDESRVCSTSPVESLDFAKAAAVQIVEQTFRSYAKRANEQTAIDATEGKDAARVMADMAKLLQLLQGLPTEIIGIMPALIEAAKRRNMDAADIVRNLINELDSEVEVLNG